MTAQPFSSRINSISTAIISGFLIFSGIYIASCAPKQNRKIVSSPVSPGTLSTSAGKKYTSAATKTGNTTGPTFFLVAQDRPAVDPKILKIYRLSVARLQIDERTMPLMSFGADGLSDYVQWEACPLAGESLCQKGTSAVSEIILGNLEAGKYSIKVQACVYKERSLFPEFSCGAAEVIDYLQEKVPKESDNILAEIRKKESDLRALGPSLYELLQTFRLELNSCGEYGTASREQMSQLQIQALREVEIQIENLTNLGRDFPGEHLGRVRLGSSDEKLAEILIENTPDDSQDDMAYNPGGLSLTDNTETKLSEFYKSRTYQWLFSRGKIIPEYNHTEAILGSSGLIHPRQLNENFDPSPLGQSDLTIPDSKEFTAMDQRQKAAVFAGILTGKSSGLRLQGSTGINQDDYAKSEFTRSFLFLTRPSELPSCQAWTRLSNNLAAIRYNIRVARDQLQQLKERLSEHK